MSTKTIGFPSNPSLDQEHQGWVWDGEKWVSDAVKGGLWEQNGDDIYYNDGDVGIGTDSPAFKLDTQSSDATWAARILNTNADGSGLLIRSEATDYTNPILGVYGDGAYRMVVLPDGRVDITGSLYVNGSEVGSGGGGLPDGDYTHNGKITATDFISTSDERLKDNITPMPIGLIDDIKPVSWDWKDGSGTSAGVVAQQLQAVGLGDYVHENEDGQLGVNYQALTAILLAEVIELKRSLK